MYLTDHNIMVDESKQTDILSLSNIGSYGPNGNE